MPSGYYMVLEDLKKWVLLQDTAVTPDEILNYIDDLEVTYEYWDADE